MTTESESPLRECPVDVGTALVQVERSGILIDACPLCRGVWLDRGELDKLIALEASASSDFLDEIQGSQRRADARDPSGHHGSRGDGRRRAKRKRGGLLGDLFDVG